MRTAIVKASELGTNCWAAVRFAGGGRCRLWATCKYPEKATCKAREAEIEYLERRLSECLKLAVRIKAEINSLRE